MTGPSTMGQVSPGGNTAGPLAPPPSPTTLEARVTNVEQRQEAAENRLNVAETICGRLINELNALRVQVGLPELDQNYYQP